MKDEEYFNLKNNLKEKVKNIEKNSIKNLKLILSK